MSDLGIVSGLVSTYLRWPSRRTLVAPSWRWKSWTSRPVTLAKLFDVCGELSYWCLYCVV